MDLRSLFFITQSILAIIVSLFLLGLAVGLYFLLKTIKEIDQKVAKATRESIEAAEEAKEVAEKVGKTIIDFLVIKIIKGLRRDGRR